MRRGGLLKGATLQPLLAYQYIHLRQDGFTETGAGVNNLAVREQTTESSRVSAGLLLTKAISTGWGTLSRYLEGRYTRELNEDSSLIDTSFVNGGPSFQAQGVSLGEHFGEVRAGAHLQLNERTTLSGGYEGRYSNDSASKGGFGQLKVRF